MTIARILQHDAQAERRDGLLGLALGVCWLLGSVLFAAGYLEAMATLARQIR